MPVQECTEDGRPGYQFGASGHCYTYDPNNDEARREAKRRAFIQGSAIEQSQGEERSLSATLLHKGVASTIRKTAPQPADIDAIKQVVGGEIDPEAVTTGSMLVCNDQIDRSHEQFPKAYLEKFADTLVGKALLTGHDYTKMPLGRFYSAGVIKTAEGSAVLGKFFFDAKNEELRRGIELGILKDVSIGFKAGGRECSVCNLPFDPFGKYFKDDDGDYCDHSPGETYDGKTCHLIYTNAEKAEAMEASIVWLGCQYGAQMTVDGRSVLLSDHKAAWLQKHAAATPKEKKLMAEDVEEKAVPATPAITPEMKALMEDGKAYRDHLKAEILRKYGACEMESTGNAMIAAMAHSNAEALKAVDTDAQKLYDQKFPPSPHSKARVDEQPVTDPTQPKKPRFVPSWGR